MYIWTAIHVDEQLASIKEEAKRIEQIVGFQESNITLPMHISLKISCLIPDERYEEAVQDVTAILENVGTFAVIPRGTELHETICWIAMEENPHLKDLHDRLDRLFLEKYGVPRHKYDLDYQYHSTLFLDSDREKVKEAFLIMKDAQIPSVLTANRFLIGKSAEGKLGTYRVIKEIK